MLQQNIMRGKCIEHKYFLYYNVFHNVYYFPNVD